MYVRRLLIENIKAFSRQEFDFRRSEGAAGWTVLVGGNASGKSTVLKLIALTLMGPTQGSVALRNLEGWIRQTKLIGRAAVEISVDDAVDSFSKLPSKSVATFSLGIQWSREDSNQLTLLEELHHAKALIESCPDWLDNVKPRVRSGPWNPNAAGWFCCGYGPWRRLSGNSADAARDAVTPGALRRQVTLFREDASLAEAEEWLRKQQFIVFEKGQGSSSGRFLQHVKRLLSSGLLPAGFEICEITSDQIHVKRGGLRLPLRDVSDGCRSVLALVLDILRHLKDCYGGEIFDASGDFLVVDVPGVVLIDEIEAHLHPTWQRELPVWLTKHFPRLQFIVTTHSPLIAQNADIDGLFVLPMPDEVPNVPRKLSREEVEQIRMGKAESTLLGAAFGLGTTRSIPAVERIERYQFLDAKRRAVALSEVEATDYAELKSMIGHQFDFEDSKAQG